MNTDLLILEYVHYALPYLSENKEIRQGVYASKCIVCGDSASKKLKRRLYLYRNVKGIYKCKCHNCGYMDNFINFMKDHIPSLYDEYRRDYMKYRFNSDNGVKASSFICNTPKITKTNRTITKLPNTIKCSELPKSHDAYVYLKYERMFDDDMIDFMLYTDDFKKVAYQLSKESSETLLENESRIIIPFYDDKGNIKIIQGRSLDKKSIRYITIKTSDDVDKSFVYKKLDKDKPIIVLEGPIDSMFIPNSIASADANLTRVEGDIYVFDNQPRNRELCRIILSAIQDGKSVVIWPADIKEKDINDMIKSGITKEHIYKIIIDNSYSGIRAKIKFNDWKQVS